MQRTLVLYGRMADSEHIELDAPAVGFNGRVEVTVRSAEDSEDEQLPKIGLFDWLASKRPGTRSKEDIDQQIAQERESWGDR